MEIKKFNDRTQSTAEDIAKRIISSTHNIIKNYLVSLGYNKEGLETIIENQEIHYLLKPLLDQNDIKQVTYENKPGIFETWARGTLLCTWNANTQMFTFNKKYYNEE